MKQFFIVSLVLLLVVFLLPMLIGGGSMMALENDDGAGTDVSAPPSVAPETEAPSALPTAAVTREGDDSLKVKVLIKEDVCELSMQDYLFGVVAAEMPADFPVEALRAQAVAARTYTESKMLSARGPNGSPAQHRGADVCDDYHHCKAYISREEAVARWGEEAGRYAKIIEEAVRDTDSLVVVYDDNPIVAVFFAMSGGRTESAKNVWGQDIPYLQEVDSPGEDTASGWEGRVEISAAELKEILLEAFPEADLDGPVTGWFGAPECGEAGYVHSIPVGGVSVPGTKLRELCGLRSTNFTVSTEGEKAVFKTVGYGHGVGLSQYGAKVMAEEGKSFEEILKWYYTGVEVVEYHPQVS